jgi:hypothetical protein
MVLPTLLLCALAWRAWQPTRRVQAAFAGLAALVLLNNLPALASYV